MPRPYPWVLLRKYMAADEARARSRVVPRADDPAEALRGPRLGEPESTLTTAIDGGAMAVLYVLSTDREDRSRDVVHADGIDTSNHASIPIGMLEHGEHHPYPIGIFEDLDKRYTVKHGDGYLTGRLYFAQSDRTACQTFALVDAGVLRGASIGFRPLAAQKRHIYDEGGYRDEQARGLEITRCELLEGSAVAIPDNPDCMAQAAAYASRGRIQGEPLVPALRKSLARYAVKRKAWRTGLGDPGRYLANLAQAREAAQWGVSL